MRQAEGREPHRPRPGRPLHPLDADRSRAKALRPVATATHTTRFHVTATSRRSRSPSLVSRATRRARASSREELRLSGIVRTRPPRAHAPSGARRRRAGPSAARATTSADSLELRDDVAVAKPEDLPALFEQMHHLGALRAQRGKSAVGSIDRKAPYFAHLRLVRGTARRRDVLIGSRSYVDPAAGIRIVDWRNAPVSRIFYRYQEGDDYEEELGDRLVEGERPRAPHASPSPTASSSRREPAGHVRRRADGRWRASRRTPRACCTVRAARGEGAAPRRRRRRQAAPGQAPARDRRDARHGAVRAHHEARARASSRSRAAPAAARPRSASTARRTSRSAEPARFRAASACSSSSRTRRCATTWGACSRRSASRACPITTFARSSRARRCTTSSRGCRARSRDDDAAGRRRAPRTTPAMLHAIERDAGRARRARHDASSARCARTLARGRARPSRRGRRDASGVAGSRASRRSAQWLAGKREHRGRRRRRRPPRRDAQRAREARQRATASSSRAVLGAWDELTHLARAARARRSRASRASARGSSIRSTSGACARRASAPRASATASTPRSTSRTTRCCSASGSSSAARSRRRRRALRFAHLFVDEVQDASPDRARGAPRRRRSRTTKRATSSASRSRATWRSACSRATTSSHGEFDWNELLKELGVPHVTARAAQGQLPLDRGDHELRARGARAARARGRADRDAPRAARRALRVRVGGRGGRVPRGRARASSRATSPDANVALALALRPQQAEVYYEGLVRAEVPNVRRVSQAGLHVGARLRRDRRPADQGPRVRRGHPARRRTPRRTRTTPQARHALYVGATRAAHQLWCTTSDTVSPVVRAALSERPS